MQLMKLPSKETMKQATYCFHSEWETQYAMVRNDNTGMICLICCAALSGFYKVNCERHDTHHSEFKKMYPADAERRKILICQLKMKLHGKNFLPPHYC
jgi:hypothetical protein